MRGISATRTRAGRWRAVIALAAVAVAGVFAAGASASSGTSAPQFRPSPTGAAGKITSVVFKNGGLQRHYTVFVPDHRAANPGLLVFLHGQTHTGEDMEKLTDLDVQAAKYGNYVVYPYGIDGSWNFTVCCPPASKASVDDIGFIDAVVSKVRNQYGIAARHVVVGGTSGGADFAFQYACSSTQRVGGVFASVGNARFAVCPRTQPLHVLAINGLKDQRNGWSNTKPFSPKFAMDAFEQFNGCGPGWNSTFDKDGNELRKAKGCRAGASIEQWVVKRMDHRWVADPGGQQKYDFNSTDTVWAWARHVMSLNETNIDAVPVTATVLSPVQKAQPTAMAAPTRLTTVATALIPVAGGVVQADKFAVGGVPGAYRLFVPTHLAAKPQLLVVLHGEGSSGAEAENKFGLDSAVGSKGHYVLYPEGSFNSWDSGECCTLASQTKSDDLHRLDLVISHVLATHPKIGNKIAISGYSAGAIMAFNYACNGSVPVSQVVGISGVPLQHCVNPRPMNVLTVNGVKDTTIYWTAKNTSSIFTHGAGTTANLTNCLAGTLGAWYTTMGTAPGVGTYRAIYGGTYPGYSMQSIVAYRLDHRWTSSTAEHNFYGVNDTAETAAFVLRYW